MNENPGEFPKYLMNINGERFFLDFRSAYVAYDNGQKPVSFGRYVLNADFSLRKMNCDDKSKIHSAAEEYSGSK